MTSTRTVHGISEADPRPAHAPEVSVSTEGLGEAIAELAARLHAATYELLVLLREFDERVITGTGVSCQGGAPLRRRNVSARSVAVWDGTPFDVAWAMDVLRGRSGGSGEPGRSGESGWSAPRQ